MSLLVSCEYGQSFKAENRKAPVQKRCKGTDFSSATNGGQENMRHPYVRCSVCCQRKGNVPHVARGRYILISPAPTNKSLYIFNPEAYIPVFLSKKVSDPRARVADKLREKNGNVGLWNEKLPLRARCERGGFPYPSNQEKGLHRA